MSNITKSKIKDKIKNLIINKKDDVSKMSNSNKEESNKMDKKEEIVSKFTTTDLDLLKKVIEDMKKVESDVKIEDFKEFILKIEGIIAVSNVADKPKVEETPKVEDKPKVEDAPKAEDVKADETPKTDDIKVEDAPKPEETPKVEDTPNVDDAKPDETPKVEDPVVEDDKASKHEEIKAYKTIAKEAVSKMKEINDALKLEINKNAELTKENNFMKDKLSKFESEVHNKMVDSVIEQISKFKDLSEQDVKSKKDELSKLSDNALEIMKAGFEEFSVSKMEDEEADVTQPSQDLDKNADNDLASKMQGSQVMRVIKSKMRVRKS